MEEKHDYMEREFNYKDSINMVCAVCKSYVLVSEIKEFFKKYPEDKQFTGYELKEIVVELVKGRKRITKGMNEIVFTYSNHFIDIKGRRRKIDGEER